MPGSPARRTPGPGRMEGLRASVLSKTLQEMGAEGWSISLFDNAAQSAGVSEEEVALAFPDGVASLLHYFCSSGDAAAFDALAEADLAGMRIPQRVIEAVHTRLLVDEPHKAAVRQAILAFAKPQHMALGTKCLYATADVLWRAAGDETQDFNRYTKRAMLAGIYGATVAVWVRDKSPGHAETGAFLERRIADVGAFEKAKAGIRTLFGRTAKRRSQ